MITGMATRCSYPIKEFTSAYLASLRTVLDEVDLEAVERITQILRRARDNRATIFIAGNGGSASTASHWVNDLGKATKRSGRAPIAQCVSQIIRLGFPLLPMTRVTIPYSPASSIILQNQEMC